MKVIQISLTQGQKCGIALFADRLQANLRRVGVAVETADRLPPDFSTDLVLVQHHDELMSDEEVRALAATSPVPLVLFAHSENAGRLAGVARALVAMCPGMLDEEDPPVITHVFPHPAWTPPRLEDRGTLRNEFGLPQDRLVVGTNGFLKFERQLVEVVSVLLKKAECNGWFIELITSPWRLDSPGLLEALRALQQQYPAALRVDHAFLDGLTLNRRLQACDLLWCWTGAPSSPYASGVASDQYASGTRLFMADKRQHGHILCLPNVVSGADRLAPFIDGLMDELGRGVSERHDPAPVSWQRCIDGFAAFLARIASTTSSTM